MDVPKPLTMLSDSNYVGDLGYQRGVRGCIFYLKEWNDPVSKYANKLIVKKQAWGILEEGW